MTLRKNGLKNVTNATNVRRNANRRPMNGAFVLSLFYRKSVLKTEAFRSDDGIIPKCGTVLNVLHPGKAKIPVPKETGIVHALTGVFCYARVAATPETVKLTFAASGLTLPDAVRARTVSW